MIKGTAQISSTSKEPQGIVTFLELPRCRQSLSSFPVMCSNHFASLLFLLCSTGKLGNYNTTLASRSYLPWWLHAFGGLTLLGCDLRNFIMMMRKVFHDLAASRAHAAVL